MTGQRGPRHTVSRPARTIATAPMIAAACQGAPVMRARPGEPAMTMACDAPPGDGPPVVDPPPAASAGAVASTLEARTPAAAAAAAPAPRTASRAPATRRAADRVAITAA